MIGASVLLKSGSSQFTISGTSSDLAGSTTSGNTNGIGAAARFSFPSDMEFNPSGDLIICDTGNNLIRKITISNNNVTTIAGGAVAGASETNGNGTAASFISPRGIAITPSGVMYIGDIGFCIIRRITGVNNTVSTFAGNSTNTGYLDGTGTTARFFNPEGITLNSSNELFVCDRGNHTIRKITTGATVSLFAGGGGPSGSINGTGNAARFNHVRSITIDGDGNFYVCDRSNYTIRKITPAGVVTTLAGLANNTGSSDGVGSSARFSSPQGIKYNPKDNNLYVCDTSNHTIRKVTLDGIVTTIAGLANSSGDVNGVGSAIRLKTPTGIAINSLGHLYIADTGNHKIKKIT